MATPTLKLYPSAFLETRSDFLEKKLEKKLKDVKSFSNSFINIEEKIVYLEDESQTSNRKYEIYQTIKSILESVYTDVLIGATLTCVSLSGTIVGLTVVPVTAGVAFALSLRNKVLH